MLSTNIQTITANKQKKKFTLQKLKLKMLSSNKNIQINTTKLRIKEAFIAIQKNRKSKSCSHLTLMSLEIIGKCYKPMPIYLKKKQLG